MNHIIALSPTDLAPAQASLIDWVDRRIGAWVVARSEAQEQYDHAVAHKWKASPFKSRMRKADRRIGFYRKIRAAIEAGYLIVPNLPLEIFAIRTKATEPRFAEANYASSNALLQSAQILPQGAGEYRNPRPLIESDEREDTKGNKKKVFYPVALEDELEIPLYLVKPQIMNAVDQARALKLFDTIGICSDRSADPIVCGTINEGSGWGAKRVTFFIAWFVDLDTL